MSGRSADLPQVADADGAGAAHGPTAKVRAMRRALGPAVSFGTKAETLSRLAPVLRNARVLPFIYFSVQNWRQGRNALLTRIAEGGWQHEALIVRSSARSEDEAHTLQPGRYLSLHEVRGLPAIAAAVDRVIESYARDRDALACASDQVLIQPMLQDATMSGVAFTCDPNTGAAYLIINYDESGDTTAVTGGRSNALRTFQCWKDAPHDLVDSRLERVIELGRELESLLGCDRLDIEFAFGADETLYLLQVRPLPCSTMTLAERCEHGAALSRIADKVRAVSRPHPTLKGARTLLGIMPDWNPAEILGTRPRMLALSLYRELITNATWAEQRYRLGYRDVRGVPLMLDLCGHPHIDVRATLNSLLPADIEDGLAEKLVNFYLEKLIANPALHDKVEFEIVFSCYTFQLGERAAALQRHGLSSDERATLVHSLRALTNRLIADNGGVRRDHTRALDELRRRYDAIGSLNTDLVSQVFWQLEDCRRYGTPAFAAFARIGFVAAELLNSLVTAGALSHEDNARFMGGLDTVSNRIATARNVMTRERFLAEYGHLRPGTYDIRQPRYDEAPDTYFDWAKGEPHDSSSARAFVLGADARHRTDRLLREHGIEQDCDGLFAFIKAGIEARENSKFEFSRQLSAALSSIARLGAEVGLDREDCSHIPVDCFRELYLGADGVGERMRRWAEEGKRRCTWTSRILLPPLITDPGEVFAFQLPPSEPNFITQKSVSAAVARDVKGASQLVGCIALIPSADPGYDWIFSSGITGLVTQFGGVNSHMAIRAHQFGIPAVVGAGEALYTRWSSAQRLLIDCVNRRVEILR